MDYNSFADSIKQKYPQYNNVDNLALAQKMVQKYPQYASKVSFNDPQKENYLQKVGTFVNKIFPGKQVGEAIGTLGGLGITAAKEKLGMVPQGTTAQYDTSSPTPLQVGGDIAQGALTVAAPGISGESALGKIGANAALGAGLGAAGGIANKGSVKDVVKQGAIGGATGGAFSAVGEGMKYLSENAPRWFTKLALPKLKDIPDSTYLANNAGGFTRTPQDIVNYTLENTKAGSLKSIYNKSNRTISSYGNQIQGVLKLPHYADETGKVSDIIPNVISQLPNAELDSNGIANIVKRVVPGSKSLVDKVAKGTANLAEQNALRSQIDQATKKIFTDSPNVSFAKEVAAKMANSLRTNVKTTAPETTGLFSQLSQELNLNNAIEQAAKKKRLLGDLIAGGAGFAKGGLKGSLEAIAIERGLRSPEARLIAAKGIRQVSKAAPAVSAITKAVKAPVIKSITD